MIWPSTLSAQPHTRSHILEGEQGGGRSLEFLRLPKDLVDGREHLVLGLRPLVGVEAKVRREWDYAGGHPTSTCNRDVEMRTIELEKFLPSKERFL